MSEGREWKRWVSYLLLSGKVNCSNCDQEWGAWKWVKWRENGRSQRHKFSLMLIRAYYIGDWGKACLDRFDESREEGNNPGDIELKKLGDLWGHSLYLFQEYDLGNLAKAGARTPAIKPSFLHPRGCSPWSWIALTASTSIPPLPTLLNLQGRKQPNLGKRLWICSMNF